MDKNTALRSANNEVRVLKAVLVVGAVAFLAGCGGSSIESKVADHTGEHVSRCSAVAKTDLGKIYSCQTDRSTVCVMVDGDDVFSGLGEAQRAGVNC